MVNAFIGLIFIAMISFPFQSVASHTSDKEEELVSFPLQVPKRQEWSFSEPFGVYDEAQLRRGLNL